MQIDRVFRGACWSNESLAQFVLRGGFNSVGFNSVGFNSGGFNSVGVGYNSVGFNCVGFNSVGFTPGNGSEPDRCKHLLAKE